VAPNSCYMGGEPKTNTFLQLTYLHLDFLYLIVIYKNTLTHIREFSIHEKYEEGSLVKTLFHFFHKKNVFQYEQVPSKLKHYNLGNLIS
jgi:hypothetical protein